MKSPADPSTRVAVDATIDAQINHSEPTFDSIIPELPIEILASILEFLKLDGHFKALTMVARANQTMYDLAIPKIYEVVGINERNVKVIGYGHGSQSLDRNEGMSQARRELLSDDEASLPVKPTRKDLATGHTRKLIIDVEPESAVPTSYTRVNEVELGPRSFCHPGIHPLGHWDYPFIKESVENVAPRDTSTPPLHVRVCIGQHTDIDSLEILLNALETPAPFSCEFLDVYIDQNEFTLFVAFLRGAVVRYRDTDLDKEEIIGEIAGQLNICIITEDFAEGRYVYLCDIRNSSFHPTNYELRTTYTRPPRPSCSIKSKTGLNR
jgi:hypothetical protein